MSQNGRRAFLDSVVVSVLAFGAWAWQAHWGTSQSAALPSEIALERAVAKSLDGRDVALSEWRGRPLLVNFWATWCGPCKKEVPELNEFHRTNPFGVIVIGVAIDSDNLAIRNFVRDHNVTYPIVVATPELLRTFPGFDSLPTSFLIDRDSTLRRQFQGAMKLDTLLAASKQ